MYTPFKCFIWYVFNCFNLLCQLCSMRSFSLNALTSALVYFSKLDICVRVARWNISQVNIIHRLKILLFSLRFDKYYFSNYSDNELITCILYTMYCIAIYIIIGFGHGNCGIWQSSRLFSTAWYLCQGHLD